MDGSTASEPGGRHGDVGEVHPFVPGDRAQRDAGLDERIDAGTENVRAVADGSDARGTVTRVLRELRELTAWALREAEEASEDVLAAAERNAEQSRRRAEAEAEQIIADARDRAQQLVDDTRAEQDRIQAELEEVRRMIARLQTERDELEGKVRELTVARTEAERELSGMKRAVESLLEELASVPGEAPPENGTGHDEIEGG